MFDFYKIPENEFGEWDEEKSSEYCEGLWQAFAASPEAAAVHEQFGRIGWTPSLLEFGFTYLGAAPPQMSRADVQEILFDLFPRKVSVESECAAEVIGELRAFFEFLHREYSSPNAKEILQDLTDEAIRELEDALGDSANFGMAKSFVMTGRGAGFDVSSQEELTKFMQVYNASLALQQDAGSAASGTESSASLTAKQRKKRDQLRRKKLGQRKRR